jgi:hypothetical protein
VLIGGQQRDPRVALKQSGGEPVPKSERSAFEQLRDRMLASIDAPSPGVVRLALH